MVIEMKSARPVSGEDLNAYIDGQLPHNRRRDIERLIGGDSGVRTRMKALLCLRELVRNAYQPDKKE